MKLLSLEVENYGVYSNEQFEFGSAPDQSADPTVPSGFCLIHGRNEAGKSTLLQLLRDVLFGIPNRSPYDFGYKGDVAARFRAILRKGERVRIRRRKGNKDTFTGTIEPPDGEGTGVPLDESQFEGILGASRDLYRQVFAFSLDELRAGEKCLEDATLTEALFGGGVGGLAQFAKLRDRIETEHRDLFKTRGSKPRINDLLQRLRETGRTLREVSVDPREFDRVQAERVEAEAEVERLRQNCDEVRTGLRSLERVERALPTWSRLVVLREDLAKLSLPEGFPTDDVERFDRLRERIENVDAEIARLEGELAGDEDAAESRVDEETLLHLEPRIRSLAEDVGRIRGYLRDLPVRREEVRTIMESVDRRTREANTEWTVADLDRFATSASDRALLDDLAEREGSLQVREAAESSRRREIQPRLDEVRRRLEQLEPNPRLAGLERLLAGGDEFRRDRARLAEVRGEIETLSATCEEHRETLGRHVGATFETPSDCPAPLVAPVDEFVERLGGIDERSRRAASKLDELREERTRLAESLSEFDVPGAAPSAEVLQRARAERDELWRTFRESTSVSHDPAGTRSVSNGDAFEQSVAHADLVADERYAHADDLARREQLEHDITRHELRIAEAERRSAAITGERATALAEWSDLWAACPFEPLAPTAMREWLAQFEVWRISETRRGQLLAEAERLVAATSGLERQLTKGFPEADGTTVALAAALRERDEAREIARQRRDLEAVLPKLESNLQDVNDTSTALAAERGEWESLRRETLRRLGLPENWTIRSALSVLAGVAESIRERDKAAGLERRIEDMQAEVHEYEARVAGVVESLDREDASRGADALETVTRFAAACDEVRSRRSAREAVEQSRSRTAERLKGLIAERTGLATERSKLIAGSGVEGTAAFAKLVETARERRELSGRVTETERQLRAEFEGADLATCESELAAAEADDVASRIASVRDEFATLEAEHAAALQTLGAIKDRLRVLDADNASADVAATIEGHRSELAAAVDQWAPRVLVQELITRALERFQRENQPEMLVEVTRLFDRMTGGRYVALQPKFDSTGTLVVQHADGTLKDPGELSTGAREQLYLAIRLAFVLKYCRDSEPLPIVMDDVLVNFDADRTRRTLEVFAEIAEKVQILFLTCHTHVVELVREIIPAHHEIELTPTGPICRPAERIQVPRRRERIEPVVEPIAESVTVVNEPTATGGRERPDPPVDTHPSLFT